MSTRHKVVCPHDCPDTCVMAVDVEEGRAVSLRGDPGHPFTRGFLCVKVTQAEVVLVAVDKTGRPVPIRADSSTVA